MGQCLTTTCHNSEQRSIPEVIDPRKLPHFVPMLTGGRVIKCYDGDTITIAAYLPFKESELYKFSVRINGIDCPEIKGQTANEKTGAQHNLLLFRNSVPEPSNSSLQSPLIVPTAILPVATPAVAT